MVGVLLQNPISSQWYALHAGRLSKTESEWHPKCNMSILGNGNRNMNGFMGRRAEKRWNKEETNAHFHRINLNALSSSGCVCPLPPFIVPSQIDGFH